VLSVGNEQDSDYRLHTAPADPTRSEATTADSAVSVRVDGVLAHREAWGLVVLQVDPEPFRVFDDLEFSNAAPAGADRIAIGPGADGRWLAPISAVQPKERTDGLAIPDRFDRRRLAGLLLDSRGEVIGIGVPSTDGNRALMIGGAELTSWISQLRDSGTPPKMPAAMDAAPDSTPDDSDSDEGAAVNRESPSGGAADTVPAATPSRPAADLASELDPLAVGSIDRLDELHRRLLAAPENGVASNYRSAAELAWRVTSIERIEDSESIDRGLRRLLSDASDRIREAWQQVAWSDDDHLAQVNLQAAESWETANGFWGYGEVEDPPGVAPRIKIEEDRFGDTVTLRLIGTDRRIAIPVSIAHDELRVGSRWLVWGTVDERRQIGSPDGLGQPTLVVWSRDLIAEPEVLIPAAAAADE